MLETTDTKNTALEIKKRLIGIFTQDINGINLGLRGYVLTKDEKMLSPYYYYFKIAQENLKSIDSLFSIQGLDTSIIAFKKNKIGFNNYLLFSEKMRLEAKNDKNSIFDSNLNGLDLGLRRYAITKDEKMLDPYYGNFTKAKSNLDSI